ncbi:MAG: glycosyltransferase family 9 protein [Candidatus Sericytochromatia bacterium]|nr:glycosyltransferase family 9 protein [Candidatus Sericytochromatia bacterium]
MTPPLERSQVRNILFVQFGGIGDVILAFPALQSLREAYPNARLTLLVEPRSQGVTQFNPVIDDVLVFAAKDRPTVVTFLRLVADLRRRRFDLAIASGRRVVMPLLMRLTGARWRGGYQANVLSRLLTHPVPLRTAQYAAGMYHDLVVPFVDAPARPPQVIVAPEDDAWADEFLGRRGLSGQPFVLLHPGSSKVAVQRGIQKTWDPRSWGDLARMLLDQGQHVVLAGGPDDDLAISTIMADLEKHPAASEHPPVLETAPFAGALPTAARLVLAHGHTRGLGQFAALARRASALVAVDSAPMHIGIGTGTPTVGLFGPTDPQKLVPAGTVHQAVHVQDLPCRPCLWERRRTTCEAVTCMKQLSLEQVADATLRVLPPQSPS